MRRDEDFFFNDPAWGDQDYIDGLKAMDLFKTWTGGPHVAEYKTYRGSTGHVTMTPGMTADNFQNVEGEPDMVVCNVYYRCLSWEGVKVPRAGFEPAKAHTVPIVTADDPLYLRALWWLAFASWRQVAAVCVLAGVGVYGLARLLLP